MNHRVVEFDNHDIYVCFDGHTDFVALKPVVEYLGLKWTNEYQRAKDKFNVQAVVIPNTGGSDVGGRLVTTLGINFGEFEAYLHSFKSRTAAFKPPNGFWHRLTHCIGTLTNEIFISSPAYKEPEPEIEPEPEVVPEIQKEKVKPIESSEPVKPQVVEKIVEVESSEPQTKESQYIETESPEPEPVESEKEAEPEVESQEQEAIQAEVDKVQSVIENNSFTAFVVGDNMKRSIDDVMETCDLFIDALTEFKGNLNQLKDAQLVLLGNKPRN